MRLFAITLIACLAGNCSSKKVQIGFSGNWYTCGKDGLYVKMLLKGDSLKQCASNGIVTQWMPFKITADTLIYFDRSAYKDSVLIKKAKLTFKDKDEIVFDYLTSNEHWTFHRIKEALTARDNNKELLKNTLKRAQKINCPDMRSETEKKADTLKTAIKPVDFQF
jgi:hypothetical protein